jgi:hypothetical protein
MLRMSESDIWRAARQMTDLYDLDAGWRAGLRADHLYEDGDVDGYQVWCRIVRAIKELREKEPCDKVSNHSVS